jgi:formylmethanofuran dehydrogenase subunit D
MRKTFTCDEEPERKSEQQTAMEEVLARILGMSTEQLLDLMAALDEVKTRSGFGEVVITMKRGEVYQIPYRIEPPPYFSSGRKDETHGNNR